MKAVTRMSVTCSKEMYAASVRLRHRAATRRRERQEHRQRVHLRGVEIRDAPRCGSPPGQRAAPVRLGGGTAAQAEIPSLSPASAGRPSRSTSSATSSIARRALRRASRRRRLPRRAPRPAATTRPGTSTKAARASAIARAARTAVTAACATVLGRRRGCSRPRATQRGGESAAIHLSQRAARNLAQNQEGGTREHRDRSDESRERGAEQPSESIEQHVAFDDEGERDSGMIAPRK